MKNSRVIILVAIAVLAVTGIAVLALKKNDSGKMEDKMSMPSNSQTTIQADTSSAEYKTYMGYQGEDYDRYFIANMIAHHQGAVDMANLALKNAKHQEIKDLATAIVSAQTSEISDMKSWQAQWGYPASSSATMMDHSAMSMEDSNAGMMNELNGKTGDAFDKAFLAQMIMHHQSAINMAAPGKTNAQHQEVKDLTATIIVAQTKEIQQMKQWQKEWGYSS